LGTKTALCDPKFPVLYRFDPDASTDFLKKIIFFYDAVFPFFQVVYPISPLLGRLAKPVVG